MRYSFADTPLMFPNARTADVQAIGETIARLRDEHDGALEPEHVWRAARADREGPLYPHFTWQLRAAAEKCWDMEARNLIRALREVDDDEVTPPRRSYLSVYADGKPAYRHVGEIERTISLQEVLLEAAIRDLRQWERRYGQILEVCEAVVEARKIAEDRLASARRRYGSTRDDEARGAAD